MRSIHLATHADEDPNLEPIRFTLPADPEPAADEEGEEAAPGSQAATGGAQDVDGEEAAVGKEVRGSELSAASKEEVVDDLQQMMEATQGRRQRQRTSGR